MARIVDKNALALPLLFCLSSGAPASRAARCVYSLVEIQTGSAGNTYANAIEETEWLRGLLRFRTKPGGHQIFGAAGHDQFLGGGAQRRKGE